MILKISRVFKPFADFLKANLTGGVILLICLCAAIFFANSSYSDSYHHILEKKMGFQIGAIDLNKSLHFWINDGLMGIFFLFVGLEIKREILEGELSSFKKASLPILAAIGGMIVPAIIYTSINFGTDTINGWGIPMATDIAFAVAILSLAGKRVPIALKVFLIALAIADDLGAILVIAIFYTQHLAINYLIYAGLIFSVLIIINKIKIISLWVYLPLGLILWYFIYMSGIHATIAGVLLAISIPTNEEDSFSTLEILEHFLKKPVAYFIMPLFALANTGITFHSNSFEALGSSVGIGIILGLFIGKPAGIFMMTWISIKLRVSELPTNTNWSQILAAGFLGGIGFTMSVFIALLSFPLSQDIQNICKLSILIASVLSAVIGYAMLMRGKPVDEKDELTTVHI